MKRRTLLEKLKIKEIRISENRPLINNFSLEITFLSFLKTKIILISNDLSQINYYKDKTKAINTTETWVVLSRTHRKRYLGCCDFFYQWAFKRIENSISHLPKIISGMALLFLSDRSALMIAYYILTAPRLMVKKHQYREPVRSTLLCNLFGKGC